jgi:transcriptional regulator with XRE-family HTH domain
MKSNYKTPGQQIRAARERKGLERPQLARKLGITPGYLAHLENDHPVRLSERLRGKLGRVGIRIPACRAEAHNTIASAWYRDYRASLRKTSRKAA